MSKQERILGDLAKGVVEMDTDLTVKASREAVEEKIDAYTAINEGLVKGMNEAGRLYEEEEYFVPELLLASDALYAGLEILTPHIKRTEKGEKSKIVLGVVQGDTHDIGKNLVKIMLEVGGFEVIDLGRDVPAEAFIDKAKEVNADMIGLSTLMTTTMPVMKKVVELLERENLKGKIRVLVGGGPVSPAFAKSIGADGYAENANNAVRVAKGLLTIEQPKKVG
ncbi:MAG: Methionine synthase [Pelotomaculum sp. PtaU1.Bin035]|nr:MAG: Methionine synthase [Pelotomaculum sp. PtaU1.Bin035]